MKNYIFAFLLLIPSVAFADDAEKLAQLQAVDPDVVAVKSLGWWGLEVTYKRLITDKIYVNEVNGSIKRTAQRKAMTERNIQEYTAIKQYLEENNIPSTNTEARLNLQKLQNEEDVLSGLNKHNNLLARRKLWIETLGFTGKDPNA